MAKKIVIFSSIAICFIAAIAFGAIQSTQLNNTRNTLSATADELVVTQSDLANTRLTLATTETELSQKQADLADAKEELSGTLRTIESVYPKIEQVTSDLEQTKADYDKAIADLDTQKLLTITLQGNLSTQQLNYVTATAGYDYALRDPTYQEVKDFLAADTTDLNTYALYGYVCEDFSFDVRLHAMQQKIRCAFVYIFFASERHAIIAFNTTDMGTIYIEPQSDEEVLLQVGKHYWSECVVPNHSPVSYDDTVSRYYIIW